MTKQYSFTKFRSKVFPKFKNNIDKTESSEDVKKFFSYAAMDLLELVFEDKINIEYDDITLAPMEEPYYMISRRLLHLKEFKDIYHNSDLPHLLSTLAETSAHKFKHMEKHLETTNTKIRAQR